MVVGIDLLLVGQRGLVVEHVGVRRWPAAEQLLDQPAVARLPGPGERVAVEDPVGLGRADHLPDADERAEQLRFALRGEDAEERSPGLPEEVDLVLVEAVDQVLRDVDDVVDGGLGRQRGGRVELVVGLARAPLVQGDDHEVVLEGLTVHAHGTQLTSSRPAGEEEEHRVVGAAAANHEGQVVTVDLHTGQLRNAAGDAATIAVDDRVRGGGAGHDHDDHQQRERCEAGRGPSNRHPRRVQRPGAPPFRGPPATCPGRPESRAEDHREEREEAVDPAAHDEGHDPVRRVEVDRVDGRAGDIEAAELEGEREGGRSDQHGPASPRHEAGGHADEQTQTQRGQGLERTQRPTGRPLRGKLSIGRRHRDDENPRDPPVSEQPFQERLEGLQSARDGPRWNQVGSNGLLNRHGHSCSGTTSLSSARPTGSRGLRHL